MIKVLEIVPGARKKNVLKSCCVLFLCAFFLFSGCSGNVFEGVSDDDSDDAKLEEARMALDDGEYSKAAQLLNDLLDGNPTDPQALVYLSHAYAGLAGLDTLDLLTIIDELDESGDSGSIDMVGLVLGDEDGDITAAEVDAKLQHLNDAIDNLEQIEANGGSLSDDETVQRGVLAVVRTAMVLADIILADQGSGSGGSIRLTEDGIDALYNDRPDFDDDVSSDQLDYLSDDIESIQEAVGVLNEMGSDNDLSEDFNEFENDLNPDGNSIITTDEVEGYVESLVSA